MERCEIEFLHEKKLEWKTRQFPFDYFREFDYLEEFPLFMERFFGEVIFFNMLLEKDDLAE